MPGVPLGAGVQVIIGGIPGVNDLQRLIYRVGKVRKVWKWTGEEWDHRWCPLEAEGPRGLRGSRLAVITAIPSSSFQDLC